MKIAWQTLAAAALITATASPAAAQSVDVRVKIDTKAIQEATREVREAVRERELPVALVEFEGEQHGFRKAENIKRSLDAELYFYSKVFRFNLAEPVEPVKIENL